jgi:hypothetical protein
MTEYFPLIALLCEDINYMIRHISRTIYVLLASILAINVILVVAAITNTTGLFPSSFYHDLNFHNAKSKISILLAFLVLVTIAYLIVDYAIRKRIAANPNVAEPRLQPKRYILFISYLYFIIFSFFNFVLTLHVISNSFPIILVFNTLLNIIPIYFISKYMLAEVSIKHVKAVFWVTTITISVTIVFPFGAAVLPFFIHHLLI